MQGRDVLIHMHRWHGVCSQGQGHLHACVDAQGMLMGNRVLSRGGAPMSAGGRAVCASGCMHVGGEWEICLHGPVLPF